MFRLRKVLVLLQICCTKNCRVRPSDEKPTHFEGPHCPVCDRAFTPSKMRVSAYDRFIVVDFEPPPYFRVLWCCCTACQNLYEINKSNWIAHCACHRCGKSLWTQEEMQAIVHGCATDLEQARAIEKARRLFDKCPHCLCDLPPVPWCPLCAHQEKPPESDCLPPSETVIWKRSFCYHESLEELQRKNQEEQASKARSQQEQIWPESRCSAQLDVLALGAKENKNDTINDNH